MRLFIASLFVFLMAHNAFSQVDKVNEAYTLMKAGNKQEAKAAIDAAAKHVATSGSPRTHYFKAWIYKGLYDDTKSDVYRQAAFQAISKSISLDTDNEYTKENKSFAAYLNNTLFNEGVAAYNQKDFANTISLFEQYVQQSQAYTPDKLDPAAYFIMGISARNINQNDKALNYLEKAKAANYENAGIYSGLYRIYKNKGQESQAGQILSEGMQKFPDDKNLLVASINNNLQEGNVDKVLPVLEKAIAREPNNIEWLLALGTVYEKQAEALPFQKQEFIDKAKNAYKKVIGLQPNNFKANFNLGIILYNSAVDVINEQSYDIDLLAFDGVVDKRTDYFKEALPYVKKANSLAPQDKSTLVALKAIYLNLNEEQKVAEVEQRLDAMNNPSDGKKRK